MLYNRREHNATQHGNDIERVRLRKYGFCFDRTEFCDLLSHWQHDGFGLPESLILSSVGCDPGERPYFSEWLLKSLVQLSGCFPILLSRPKATLPLGVCCPVRYISVVFASLEGGTGKLLLDQILSCQRERGAYDCTSQW
jgi:hypothetical protein